MAKRRDRARRGTAEWWADRQRARRAQDEINTEIIDAAFAPFEAAMSPVPANGVWGAFDLAEVVNALQAHNMLAESVASQLGEMGQAVVMGFAAGLQGIEGGVMSFAQNPNQPPADPLAQARRALADLEEAYATSLAIFAETSYSINTQDGTLEARMIAGEETRQLEEHMRFLQREIARCTAELRQREAVQTRQQRRDQSYATMQWVHEREPGEVAYMRRNGHFVGELNVGPVLGDWVGGFGQAPPIAVPPHALELLNIIRKDGWYPVDTGHGRRLIEKFKESNPVASDWMLNNYQLFLTGLTVGFYADPSLITDWEAMELDTRDDHDSDNECTSNRD